MILSSRRWMFLLLSCLLVSARAWASDGAGPLKQLGEIPIQDGGRVMPLEAYAQRLAVDVTGRSHWSSGGPENFTGRSATQLMLDCMFKGRSMLTSKVITIEDKPFKRLIGVDAERRFFSPSELATTKGLNELLGQFEQARAENPQASPTPMQRKALNVREAANRIANLADGEMLAVVPGGPGQSYRHASAAGADAGLEQVQAAWTVLGKAYAADEPIGQAVDGLRQAIAAAGTPTAQEQRAVELEVFYGRHRPWMNTAVLYGLAIVLFGLSRLTLKTPLTWLALLCTFAGMAEHVLGVVLRVMILNRAPVSNTFEALLWMGLVGIIVGLIAQMLNKGRGWYLFAGVSAAMVSVLFAGLVPLTDRTNSLPAVLRSNFWLIIHVLTIVASYGVLAVASVLGHAFLIKDVILARRSPESSRRSAELVVQTYRTIQVGLILLTAGTILGGVWAAESWGRFWGWDPKETWALISILVYFAVLHARYVRWLKDFGLAAAAVLGLVVIVWTFYGVNYVMATGLHSYGFGSGGEQWVGLWAILELIFLVVCWVRYRSLKPSADGSAPPASRPSVT